MSVTRAMRKGKMWILFHSNRGPGVFLEGLPNLPYPPELLEITPLGFCGEEPDGFEEATDDYRRLYEPEITDTVRLNEEVRTEMGKVAEVLRWLSNESLKKGEEQKSEFHTGQGIGLMRAVIYLEDEYFVIKPVESKIISREECPACGREFAKLNRVMIRNDETGEQLAEVRVCRDCCKEPANVTKALDMQTKEE